MRKHRLRIFQSVSNKSCIFNRLAFNDNGVITATTPAPTPKAMLHSANSDARTFSHSHSDSTTSDMPNREQQRITTHTPEWKVSTYIHNECTRSCVHTIANHTITQAHHNTRAQRRRRQRRIQQLPARPPAYATYSITNLYNKI